MKKPIAVFVSGQGSLLKYLLEVQLQNTFEVVQVVTSHLTAHAVKLAESHDVPVFYYDGLKDEAALIEVLKAADVQLVVLAGFIKMVPATLLREFPKKVINTHPSLLPKFGGKGMYGRHVHQAVIDAGEALTGCTTHFVTEEYDKGQILQQKKILVEPEDTPETLQNKVKELEKENLVNTLNFLLN